MNCNLLNILKNLISYPQYNQGILAIQLQVLLNTLELYSKDPIQLIQELFNYFVQFEASSELKTKVQFDRRDKSLIVSCLIQFFENQDLLPYWYSYLYHILYPTVEHLEHTASEVPNFVENYLLLLGLYEMISSKQLTIPSDIENFIRELHSIYTVELEPSSSISYDLCHYYQSVPLPTLLEYMIQNSSYLECFSYNKYEKQHLVTKINSYLNSLPPVTKLQLVDLGTNSNYHNQFLYENIQSR